MSGCHGGQADGSSIVHGRERLKGHAAAAQGPLIILFQQQGGGEPDDGGFIEEYADHVGAALDLAPRIKSAGKLLRRSSVLVL